MFILGKKMKMTQIWKDKRVIPVTVVKAEPNTVTLARTKERDGYVALQVKMGKTKMEFRDGYHGKWSDAEKGMSAGSVINVGSFAEGDKVKVSGLTKGRGFQGVVKRHGFGGGPKTHGQKNRFRAPGSIGSTAFQRVVPGRRMAGRMGQERITLLNLKIAGVDTENNLLFVKGAIPGATGTLVEISKIVKN